MGFGSYKTAWTWLHKLRRVLVRPGRELLCAIVQLDEGFVGGKGSEKSMVLVGAEPGGRVRLADAENNDEATLKRFADAQVAETAQVTTDGSASYNARSLGGRPHGEGCANARAKAREGCRAELPLGDLEPRK